MSMAIDDIVRKIEKETEEEKASIISKAQAEARVVSERYASAIEKMKKELEDKARAKAAEEEKRLIVNEQLEERKALLAKKREILEDIYKEARRTILSMPKQEYLDLISFLIAKKAVSGNEEIIVSKSQKDYFDSAFIERINKDWGEGAGFTVSSEAGNFEWGVVLREGKRSVDLTLDVLFDQIIEDLEPRLADVLFSDEG